MTPERLEELRKASDHYYGYEASNMIGELCSEVDALTKRVKELEVALEKYGEHCGFGDDDGPDQCGMRDDWVEALRARVITRPCDCGFDKLVYGAVIPAGTPIFWNPKDGPMRRNDLRAVASALPTPDAGRKP